MKLIFAAIASFLLVAVSAELLTVATYRDAQCTDVLTYSTNNIFSCKGLPVGTCKPAAEGLYAMLSCSSQWPKPTATGVVIGLFGTANCTGGPNNLSFWGDKKCVPEGAGSVMRSCEMPAPHSPIMRATYCGDNFCTTNCTSQVWKLTETSPNSSGMCNNAGPETSVLFQCYTF